MFLILISFPTFNTQIAIADLSQVGIIQAKNYNLKIQNSVTTQLLVINLVPYINESFSCKDREGPITEYKKMVSQILIPINQSLEIMRSAVKARTSGLRFWGAVVGGVALGVATSAQITAGIALHNTIQNANEIQKLKDSIVNSNAAIQKLQDAQGQTIVAISALQEQINNNIIPNINKLSCDVLLNSLRLKLNQYFSIISLIFGPNLRDPASETLSIQSIAQAFNGDFESLLKELDYNNGDFLDVLESDSIRGKIIDVDLTNFLLVLQISYPSMIEITGATVQDFNLITFNDDGEEWLSVFPSHLLIRGNLISNIDVSSCVQTSNSYICYSDTSSPISNALYNCAKGDLRSCARTRVINSHAPRFALSQGVIFANCIYIQCTCRTSGQNIIQDSKSSNTMISSEFCPEVIVDNIYVTVGKKVLNRTVFSNIIEFGQPIVTDQIDISNQLAQVESSLSESKNYLEKSNEILRRVNPSIVNTESIIFLIIVSVILLIFQIIIISWLIYLTKITSSLSRYNEIHLRDSTVNSLSSLIPVQ